MAFYFYTIIRTLSEFINFINYLKALYEEESEEINKLCIKYRVNNELFKWYIYMNGLIEIENGKKKILSMT